MIVYKLQIGRITGTVGAVSMTDTETNQVWHIPFDPANTDYQQYLAWVSEGNQPEPADA